MYFPYMFGKKDKNKHSFIKLIFTPLAYIQKYQIIFQKKNLRKKMQLNSYQILYIIF